ncbi:SH3 domain-containing protein [Thermoflexus sp.]|uniref:SH3 domain-containing protein n=1 Tax=Thermoflexus sp. TaxID=1969742 RepID=UPI0025F78495|nr:SH3 domain-containing protein [Thermoflexus sp.]MCS6963522.1 SH3 domain-containing protein [Thermoflexus sp.]MCS7351730.1 SH3 domain-containing protein [Thermoflexus sp.]MDW8181188.1 SH3 domain-containing protein [Anaerolineae bacterium]MDW8183855.1 SH3 domain-containing protein [Anaerolineae bacterium]
MGKRAVGLVAIVLLGFGLWMGLAQFRPAARQPPPSGTARIILITRSPAPSPTLLPSPTPTSMAQRMVVTGTGGLGLRLREGPGLLYAVVTILNEGTPLSAFPESVEADGLRWRRVRTEDGAFEGWVAEPYLAPTD